MQGYLGAAPWLTRYIQEEWSFLAEDKNEIHNRNGFTLHLVDVVKSLEECSATALPLK